MQQELYKFNVKHNQKYSASILSSLAAITEKYHGNFNETQSETIGGIIRDGQLGWISIGPHIQIISLKTGTKIASHTFDQLQWGETVIICVSELQISTHSCGILAICLQSSKHGGVICIYTIQGSRILRTIEIVDKISCCSFLSVSSCKKSDLVLFDGCLAVGTEVGKVILIDLALKKCDEILHRRKISSRLNDDGDCLIALAATCSHKELIQQQQKAQKDGINFGVQLEILEDAGPVASIMSLEPLLSIAVGLSDGRLLLYTLNGLEAYHLAYPPEPNSPLTQMTFIEPADDPRACVYLWAFHNSASCNSNSDLINKKSSRNNSNDCAIAVMHSITFETKVATKSSKNFNNNDEYYVYKNFQTSSSRLTMPTFGTESYPIVCQSIAKSFADSDEDILSLCLLAWTSPLATTTTVCLFDLNQWYKEQMPSYCDWRETPSYLAIFSIDHSTNGNMEKLLVAPPLDIWMDKNTVTPFCSIQRPEEHFYPSALSFHCIAFTSIDSSRLAWSGIQHQILDKLGQCGPNIFLEPNGCFAEMIQASLIPQFCDFNYNTKYSVQFKQEFLLSIALEYGCTMLLRQCAKAWADGSYLGKYTNENGVAGGGSVGGLSLSTLTDWIWERATLIKNCCNQLCIPLFDYSVTTIDMRSKKMLLHCTRQLQILSDLLTMICTTCQQFIPNEIMDTLISQRNSIRMVLEYQEMLQWMLNIGLLPEQSDSFTIIADNSLPVYPYRQLKNAYLSQRRKFYEINSQLLSGRHGCRILYIDAFIEHNCNPLILRNEWKIRKSDVLYPPPTLQAMLRTLLVPGVDLQTKYMLFVYLFLDLCVTLENEGERFSEIVRKINKFPMAFKLDPIMCKTTKAFWNLDHGFYEAAIDDLISPLSQHSQISQWQQNILIESLLTQKMYSLALRVIRVPGPPVSPFLEIQTLMENNLVIEAFQLQRQKYDESLLMDFFKYCHQNRKWHYVLDLSLNETEEKCLGKFLKSTNSNIGENLHFLYLIQRGKYIEAIQFIDELHQHQQQHEQQQQQQHHQSRRRMPNQLTMGQTTTTGGVDFETPSTILKAYKLTMTPATRQISDIYYSIKDNINTQLNRPDSQPIPLSSNLLQSKLNLMGGVYHRSVLSAEQTTSAYWYNQKKRTCQLSANTIPFLRNPQYVRSQMPLYYPQYQRKNNAAVSIPSVYQNKKRNLDESFDVAAAATDESVDYMSKNQAPVKRRRIGGDSSMGNVGNKFTTTTTTTAAAAAAGATTGRQRVNESAVLDNNEDFETTLTTPMVVSSQNSEEKTCFDRVVTPQSILKSKSGRNSRCSTYSTDSIRFNLPESPDFLDDITQPIATSSILEEDDSMTGDDQNIVRQVENMSGDDEDDDDVDNDNDDEYCSAELSQDPELIVTSTFQFDGPSPRKRLRSFSKQQQEEQPQQQKPPPQQQSSKMDISSNEPILKPSLRRSTRSRSKTPDIEEKILTRRSIRSGIQTTTETTDQSDQSSSKLVTTSPNRKLPGPPLRRKPLSRLVLEANAKKVTENLLVQNEVIKEVVSIDLSIESPQKTLFESSLDLTNENYINLATDDPVNDSTILNNTVDNQLNQLISKRTTLFDVDDSSVESDNEISSNQNDIFNLQTTTNVADLKQPSIERIIPVNLLNTDSQNISNKEFEMVIEVEQQEKGNSYVLDIINELDQTTKSPKLLKTHHDTTIETTVNKNQPIEISESINKNKMLFSLPLTISLDESSMDKSIRKPLFENSQIESSESFMRLWNAGPGATAETTSANSTLNDSKFYKRPTLFSSEDFDTSGDFIKIDRAAEIDNVLDDDDGDDNDGDDDDDDDEHDDDDDKKADYNSAVLETPKELEQTTGNTENTGNNSQIVSEIRNKEQSSLLTEPQQIQTVDLLCEKNQMFSSPKTTNILNESSFSLSFPSLIIDKSFGKRKKLFENSQIESSESFMRLWNAGPGAVAATTSANSTLNESTFYKRPKLFTSEDFDSSCDLIEYDYKEIDNDVNNKQSNEIIQKPELIVNKTTIAAAATINKNTNINLDEDSQNLWINDENSKDIETENDEKCDTESKKPVQPSDDVANEIINISSSSSSSSASSRNYENLSDEIEEIEDVEDDEHYEDDDDDDDDDDDVDVDDVDDEDVDEDVNDEEDVDNDDDDISDDVKADNVYDVVELDEDIESIDMKNVDDEDEEEEEEEEDEDDEDDGDDDDGDGNDDDGSCVDTEEESNDSDVDNENIVQLKGIVKNNDENIDDVLLSTDQVINIHGIEKEPVEMSTLTDTLSVNSELNQCLMATDSDLNNSLYLTDLTEPPLLVEPVALDNEITLADSQTTNNELSTAVEVTSCSDNLNIAVYHENSSTMPITSDTITETEPTIVVDDEIDKTTTDTNTTNQTVTDLNVAHILTETISSENVTIEVMEIDDDELKNQSLIVDEIKNLENEKTISEQPEQRIGSPTLNTTNEIPTAEINKNDSIDVTSQNSNESMHLNISSDIDASKEVDNIVSSPKSPIQTRLRSNSTSSNTSKKSNTKIEIKTNLNDNDEQQQQQQQLLSRRQLRSTSVDSPALTTPQSVSTPILRNLRARSVTANHTDTIDSPKTTRRTIRRGQSEEPKSLITLHVEENTENLNTPKSKTSKRKSVGANTPTNDNDDSISVASSEKSNRTTRSSVNKNKATNKSVELVEHDDDNESVVSLRSNRSYVRNRKLKGPLPAITEDDITEQATEQATEQSTTEQSTTEQSISKQSTEQMTDYTISDRRLTRGQITMMEKVQKAMKDQSEKAIKVNKEQIARARRQAAAAGSSSSKQQSVDDEIIDVNEDHLSESGSVKSKMSLRSTRSTRSNKKTSQVDSKSKGGKLDLIAEINNDSDDGNSSIITTRSRTSNKSHRATTSKAQQ